MGGDDDTGENGVAGDEDLDDVSIQVAHTSPPRSNERDHIGALAFQEYLETATDGRISVDIAPSGELGGTFELTDQAMEGAIEICAGTTDAHLSVYYPNYNLMGIPYMFPDINLANYVLDTEWGQDFIGGFEQETGLNVIGWYDGGGFDSFSVAGTELTSVDDFDGLDIRVMESPAHATLVEELGATPNNVEWTEMYEALDQGVIDGQKNAVQTFITGNFEEVQDFILMDEHQYSFMNVCANQDWFDDLHPIDQRLVEEAGVRWSMRSRKMNRVMREQGRIYVENEGVEVHDPSEDFIEELREATQDPVEEVVRDQVDDPNLVDELYDAVDQAQEDLGYN